MNIELIKQLRAETGAGLADVKEALEISKNDLEAAKAYLTKKGIAKADKRAERDANQGIVSSYVHNTNKIGVLVEVNCETDFVAQNQELIAFGREVALQICAMNPLYVDRTQIPENIKVEFKKEVQNDPKFAGKPEAAFEKILESKFNSYAEENCLLEQKYFKDGSVSIQDMMKAVSAKTGEAVKIKRFVRFEIGA